MSDDDRTPASSTPADAPEPGGTLTYTEVGPVTVDAGDAPVDDAAAALDGFDTAALDDADLAAIYAAGAPAPDDDTADLAALEAEVAAWSFTVDDADPVELVEDDGPDAWPSPPQDWDPAAHDGEDDVARTLLFDADATDGEGQPLRGVSIAGYPVSSRPASIGVRSFTVPGTNVSIPLRADVAPLLIYFLREWHRRVEPLRKGWCWGYAFRLVRGYATPSFHSAGLAADANAPKHPLGVAPSRTLTARQIAEIRKIVKELGGTVRWGGDYRGRKDAMHGEVIAVRAVALAMIRRLQTPAPSRDKPRPAPAGKPAPKPTPRPAAAPAQPRGNRPVLTVGAQGPWVRYVQYRLGFRGADVDGKYGPRTRARVVALQTAWRKKDRRVLVDGKVGAQTWGRLGVRAVGSR